MTFSPCLCWPIVAIRTPERDSVNDRSRVANGGEARESTRTKLMRMDSTPDIQTLAAGNSISSAGFSPERTTSNLLTLPFTIRAFPGYSVTSTGEVIGRDRRVKDKRCGFRLIKARVLRPCLSMGYHYVTLMGRRRAVHQLVCEAFHGAPPAKADVNHKDGDKTNNAASNLEWVTRSENQLHAANNGLKPVGEESHLACLTGEQVREIRSLVGQVSQSKLAVRFGVSQTCISKIATRKKWKQLT